MDPFGHTMHHPFSGGEMNQVLSLQTLSPSDEAALSLATTGCTSNGCTTNSCSSDANTNGCTTNGCVCDTMAIALPE